MSESIRRFTNLPQKHERRGYRPPVVWALRPSAILGALLLALFLMGTALGQTTHQTNKAAPTHQGINWHVQITDLSCPPWIPNRTPPLWLEFTIRYVGPQGQVQAPVAKLIDAAGREYEPGSVGTSHQDDPAGLWLIAKSMRLIQMKTNTVLRGVMYTFRLDHQISGVKFRFADVPAFPIVGYDYKDYRQFCSRVPGWKTSYKSSSGSRKRTPVSSGNRDRTITIFDKMYPCRPREAKGTQLTTADYPPYLPERMISFSRGWLPNTQEAKLPMGRATVQPFMYDAEDPWPPPMDYIQRVVASWFPEFTSPLILKPGQDLFSSENYYVFKWGMYRFNDHANYLVGIYRNLGCR